MERLPRVEILEQVAWLHSLGCIGDFLLRNTTSFFWKIFFDKALILEEPFSVCFTPRSPMVATVCGDMQSGTVLSIPLTGTGVSVVAGR